MMTGATVPCPHCQAPIASDARFCGACGQSTQSGRTAYPSTGSAAPAPAPDMIGRQIGGFRILAKLGEGGMGAVYKAEQISLKRQCAVKLLRPDVSGSELMLRRFNAEAELVAKLSHPNTVNIYDFGHDPADGTLFIAMEFIEGKSLRSVIHNEAPLPLRRALQIAAQVASSLTDAHARSIIHRDLKPDNVMLQERGRTKDVVRVLDFGIAKLRDEGRATQMAMTQAGDMLGTPQYMAPEQIRAEQIDGRTDVYALGCMLYEMVTGKLPYEGPTIMALLSKHLTENAAPPSVRRPDLFIPPTIDDLIMSAMAKDAQYRPPTMEAYGERIAAALDMLPPETGAASAQRSSALPLVHMPTPPPPPTGPAPYYPSPPPYQTNQPAFVTPPPLVEMQPFAPPPPKSSGSGKTALWIALIVLVLGGAGAGIFFATRKDKVADPTRPPKPEVEFDDEGSGTDEDVQDLLDKIPDHIDIPDIKIPTPSKGDSVDNWDNPAPGGVAATGDRVEEVVSGVKLNVPMGFTVTRPSGRFAATGPGVFVVGVSVEGAPSDDAQLIRLYAQGEKMKLLKTEQRFFAGQNRLLGFMQGTPPGADIELLEVVAVLKGPGYHVAMILAIPTVMASDSTYVDNALNELSSRIILP